MKNLAEKIKELRAKENLTQEEFAKRIFVSREAVSKWEQNRGIPDIENLKTISKAFNITLDNLLDNETAAHMTLDNVRAITKMKKIQVMSSSVIALCLVFFIIFGLINFPANTPKTSDTPAMPEGVLIGFYIDTNADNNVDIKSIIDNGKISNDIYAIRKPFTNDVVHQGIHNINDISFGDYSNYQCDIFISVDIVEISKYYSVYFNYTYFDYQKPHGYTLVEITDKPTFNSGQTPLSFFLYQYNYRYVIYDAEVFTDRITNFSYYFNVFAVKNFSKMKISEFDEKYNELLTAEVKNGDIYTLQPKTYQLKLYYTDDSSTWFESYYGTFMFGGNEPYDVTVYTQITNKHGFVDEKPFSTFRIVR